MKRVNLIYITIFFYFYPLKRQNILLYIQFWWHIHLVRYIFSILFSLPDTFGQQIFDLPIYRTEIIFCPSCNCIIQFCRQSKWYLLFFFVCHTNTNYQSLRSVGHLDYHKEQLTNSIPLLPFVLHLTLLHYFHSNALMPFPPYQQHHLQSSFSHQ